MKFALLRNMRQLQAGDSLGPGRKLRGPCGIPTFFFFRGGWQWKRVWRPPDRFREDFEEVWGWEASVWLVWPSCLCFIVSGIVSSPEDPFCLSKVQPLVHGQFSAGWAGCWESATRGLVWGRREDLKVLKALEMLWISVFRWDTGLLLPFWAHTKEYSPFNFEHQTSE